MTFTNQNADNVAANLSHKLRGFYVVAYADNKNGSRIVLNVYPITGENSSRIKNQIKTNKARVFAVGTDMTETFA